MNKFFNGILLLVTFTCFGYNCTKQTHYATPEHLIDEDQLVSVLVDMHVADIVLGDKRMIDRNILDEDRLSYNAVMHKYAITRDDFEANMKYYTANLNRMQLIYNKVLDTLNTRLDTLMKSDTQ